MTTMRQVKLKDEYLHWLCEGLRKGWLGRGDRYTLEDLYGKKFFPEKVRAGLIPMSVQAEKMLLRAGLQRKASYSFYTKLGLRYEHRVPLSKIKSLVAELDFDPTAVKEVLYKYFQVVWITQEEDELLRNNGLNSKMPDGWKIGDDPSARYHKVGIQVCGDSK